MDKSRTCSKVRKLHVLEEDFRDVSLQTLKCIQRLACIRATFFSPDNVIPTKNDITRIHLRIPWYFQSSNNKNRTASSTQIKHVRCKGVLKKDGVNSHEKPLKKSAKSLKFNFVSNCDLLNGAFIRGGVFLKEGVIEKQPLKRVAFHRSNTISPFVC